MKGLLLIIALLLSGFEAVAEARPIRVLILSDSKELNISASSKLEIKDLGNVSPMLIVGRSGGRCSISLSKGRLLIDNLKGTYSPILVRTTQDSPLTVNGRRYRGEIEVRRGERGIEVINIVDLEEYLYGVIKREISPHWSMEAVKAQAVVARTFAHYNLFRHDKEGYDLCNTYHCQVYGGMTSEDPRSIEAVDATRNEILAYEGRSINAIYHATCGGHTADASLVWPGGGGLAYLKGVSCPFCKQSPHYSWHYRIRFSEISSTLREKGYTIGSIQAISLSKKDDFGRVGELSIRESKGEIRIGANAFRLAMDPGKIRSTSFRILQIGDEVIFEGLGWGHGVGMCQWGAKGMAELGFNYEEILGYYYPNTRISRIGNQSEAH